MARHEEDREDLMKEATALVRRIEIQLNNDPEPVFAGYKRTGYLSIYLTPDRVYHFDEQNFLRRAVSKSISLSNGRKFAYQTGKSSN